jgi:phosphate-selective porin OprO/OprP
MWPWLLESRTASFGWKLAMLTAGMMQLGVLLGAAEERPSSAWYPPDSAVAESVASGAGPMGAVFVPPGRQPQLAWLPSSEATTEPENSLPELGDPEPSVVDRLDEMEKELKRLTEAAEKSAAEDAETPTSRFTMELQADAYTFRQDAVNVATVGDIPEGTAFRRARVGWTGDWHLTEYRIEFDFAQFGRPTFLDVWAGLTDVPVFNTIRVGHFFEPFSLERLTSNRFMTFMERSLGDSPFAPARNMGIAAYNHSEDERMTWAFGFFADRSNDFGDDVGEDRGEAVTGRITWLPYWENSGRHYLHLGVANSVRRPDEELVSYASRPEARLGGNIPNVPDFVDTGDIAAEWENRSGLEAAWIFGALAVQSEYMCAAVDQIGGPSLFFYGGYIESSWFLTGEHRPYNRRSGILERVIPHHNFCWASRSGPRGCGWGAWQVAARVSHLDGNDENILGRELTNVTVGLNWYLTPYLRFTSNYIHAFLDDPTLGDSDADIMAMRIGYDF